MPPKRKAPASEAEEELSGLGADAAGEAVNGRGGEEGEARGLGGGVNGGSGGGGVTPSHDLTQNGKRVRALLTPQLDELLHTPV